jgi:hypothetical protein
MVIQEQALKERTKSLVHAGAVWSDRIVEGQRDFIRQLSLAAIGVDQATDLLGIGLNIAEGGQQIRGAYSWPFLASDVKAASPDRWGYVTRFLQENEVPANGFQLKVTIIHEAESVSNTSGDILPFVQDNGMVTLLPPGTDSTTVPVEGYAEVSDQAHYSGTSGIGVVVGAPSYLGITEEDENEPFLVLGGSEDYTRMLSEGTVAVTRSPQAAWFLRLPQGTLPLALETRLGDLVAGAAFHTVEGWLILCQDPYLLWPDGIAHATNVLRAPDGPKHFALKTDRSKASGKWVANYKRQSQSPGSFLKALAEVAGLPIFEEDDQVLAVEACASGFRYHTLNGAAFLLPGPAAYVVGDFLVKGEFPRSLMDLRCQPLQGDQWWDGRAWLTEGIDISLIRPGFSGFYVGPALTLAEAYEDPVDGSLRARLMFNHDEEEEARYWTWQAAMERRAGTESFARDHLGFNHPGEAKWVNPLQIYAGILGPWLWVVESPLPNFNQRIWREVEDFIAREKPAGLIVVTATTDSVVLPSTTYVSPNILTLNWTPLTLLGEPLYL